MVADADGEQYRGYYVAGSSLRRVKVIGKPLAARIFAIIDAVFEPNSRLFR